MLYVLPRFSPSLKHGYHSLVYIMLYSLYHEELSSYYNIELGVRRIFLPPLVGFFYIFHTIRELKKRRKLHRWKKKRGECEKTIS